MAGRAAPRAIDRTGVRGCRSNRRHQRRRRCAPVATDKSAPVRYAARTAARQRPPPDAEIVGGEVSLSASESAGDAAKEGPERRTIAECDCGGGAMLISLAARP